jgi:hypothetical protein
MYWVTLQLATWAKSKLSAIEIEKAIRKKINHPDLQIYYPVTEDMYGKQDSPYSEYVFLSYVPEIDYSPLDGCEEFVSLLKEPRTRNPQLTPDAQIERVRNQVCALTQLKPEDVVKIMEGPLRGNYGVVRTTYVGEATLSVTMGSETIEASIPIQHLRFSRKRTILRKRKSQQRKYLEEFSKTLTTPPPPTTQLPQNPTLVVINELEVVEPNHRSEDQKIQKVVRRGLKNTRVIIGGQSVLLTNEELKKRLTGSSLPLE